MGPPRGALQIGESVTNYTSRPVGRRGRGSVKIRIVGDLSFGWVEAAKLWGGDVEAVVHKSDDNHRLISFFDHPRSVGLGVAASMSPHGEDWEGILLGTLTNDYHSFHMAEVLFSKWQPSIAIFAVHSSIPRRHISNSLPKTFASIPKYRHFWQTCSHHEFGGVSLSSWHILHFHRLDEFLERSELMTPPGYLRHLQGALFDTLGGPAKSPSVELFDHDGLSQSLSQIGFVKGKERGSSFRRPLYSSSKLAPDISTLDRDELYFWVDTQSVFTRGRNVVRQVTRPELFAIWDYEGKLESADWDLHISNHILFKRLMSPPGKIIRSFLFKACELLSPVGPRMHKISPTLKLRHVGKTDDIPFSPLEKNVSVRVTAALGDDREVDLSTWALEGETEEVANARQVLRRFVLRYWKWKAHKDAYDWLASRKRGGLLTPFDAPAVEDCLSRVRATTYWTWVRGSRLLFFRYTDEAWLADARDGVPFWQLSKPPEGIMKNHPSPSREVEILQRRKVFKLRFQRNISPGYVSLVMPRFPVPKADDIRVVWDGSANGHNATLYAPGFMNPTFHDVENLVVKWLPLGMSVGDYLDMGSPIIDYTQEGISFTPSVQGDVDVGSMFHNYKVHPRDKHTLGVRVYFTRHDGGAETCIISRYEVLPFGSTPSPFIAGQGQLRVIWMAKGNRHNKSNPFQWERVHLNLPCAIDYDPSLPRVILLRHDNEIASGEAAFVDDIHVVGRGMANANQACKRLKSQMNHFGNQADDAKYRPPTTTPGAWNGSILHTDTPFPRKSTTGKKWTRFRDGLKWIVRVSEESKVIDTAELRRVAGLGVHLTEVYASGRPFLKGMFNAIEAFRADRDLDGWRLSDAEVAAALLEAEDSTRGAAAEGYPLETRITHELIRHVGALLQLFSQDAPLSPPVRPTDKFKLRYMAGDASLEGYGTVTQYPDDTLSGRDGLWDPEFAFGGSNLREAQAQVNHLLEEVRAGKHDGCELWAFTDNAVWSAVWNKGMSSARHLFDLVVSLKLECRDHEVWLHVCHISGNRMIATGIDGWSRGNQDAGVSLGYDIRQFVPLNLGAFELHPALGDWCESWMGSDYSPPLGPEGWFWEGHHPGVHVWSPPPAAALIALKQVALSRHKRPYDVTHVFICQRLLWQEEWRSRFEKEFDIWFIMHPGLYWPHHMFEPLLVGIFFPMSRDRPWLVRLLKEEVVAFGRSMSQMSKTCHIHVGDYLRQLWAQPRNPPKV